MTKQFTSTWWFVASKIAGLVVWLVFNVMLVAVYQSMLSLEATPIALFLMHMALIAWGLAFFMLGYRLISLILQAITLPLYYELTDTHLAVVSRWTKRKTAVPLSELAGVQIKQQDYLARRLGYGTLRFIMLQQDQSTLRVRLSMWWRCYYVLTWCSVDVDAVLAALPTYLDDSRLFHARLGSLRFRELVARSFWWGSLLAVFFARSRLNSHNEVWYAAWFWSSFLVGMHLVKVLVWCLLGKAGYSISTTKVVAFQENWWQRNVAIFKLNQVKACKLNQGILGRWLACTKVTWILNDDTTVLWRAVPDVEALKRVLAELNVKIKSFLS